MSLKHFRGSDGARLAYRDDGEGPAVLALSGLTRTGRDFDYLALHLAGVRLIRPDYRGRGGSDWTGAETYTVQQEADDALTLLDHLGIARAALIGTSRGGLIGLFLASVAKERLTGILFNDVGPELAPEGLQAITGYIGRNPPARSHADLAARMPAMMRGFSNVPPVRWAEEVERLYDETPEGLRITYDPALREAFLASVDGDLNLWPLFDACEGLPLALLRGANSELLSAATAAEMRRRRPDMLFADVPDRAHVPFLDEPESLALIRAWLDHTLTGQRNDA